MNWRLDPRETGLVVVDIQERLVPAIADGERVVGKAAQLVALAKLFSIPVFAAEHVAEKLGPLLPALGLGLGEAGAVVVPKRTFSAAPALEPLARDGTLPKTLVVCGIETHVCVRQTVYDLRALGRSVVLAADACGSRSPLDHGLALDEMRADKVLCASVEALGFELAGSVDAPQFKAVLSLFK